MRKLPNWITSYLEYTKYQESPEIFHKWVGISCLSSILERNVCMELLAHTIYPNLYIMLVAKTGICRKSTCINMGYNLVKSIKSPPVLIKSKITPEALVNRISIRTVGKDTPSAATATVIASELANFLDRGKNYASLIPILTELYDCEDEWSAVTIGRPEDMLIKPGLVFISATTPSWLQDSMNEYSIEGGFANRIIFVYQDKTDRCFPDQEITPEHLALAADLTHDLNVIRNIIGTFRKTDAAKKWYNRWYEPFHRQRQVDEEANDIVIARKDIMLHKIAMIFSVAKDDSRIVDVCDYKAALEVIDYIDIGANELARMLHKPTRFSSTISQVYKCIKDMAPDLRTKSYILKRSTHFVNSAREFEEILIHLIRVGEINTISEISSHKGPKLKKYRLANDVQYKYEDYFPLS